MDYDKLAVIVIAVIFVLWCFGSGRGSPPARREKAGRGIWSGDTQVEEDRRNTRTDSNYRGYGFQDRWNSPSDKGW